MHVIQQLDILSVVALNSLMEHRDVHYHGIEARVNLDLRKKVNEFEDEHVDRELLLKDERHNHEDCNHLTQSVQNDLPPSKGGVGQKAEKRSCENNHV